MNKIAEKVVDRKILVPFILITSIFFLWGIANDLTNPMVLAFKKVMQLSNVKSTMVQFAFYGGYATMAIPAALFIRRFSYKSGVLIGLGLYAIGALLFWPAAKLEVFGFFLASLYILTFGLAFLETTCSPYILSMGSPATAARRLTLSQTFNPVGSLSGMVMAQFLVITVLQSSTITPEAYQLLPDMEKAAIRTNDLGIISGPYIALGLYILLMFVIIAFMKMPKKAADVETIPFVDTIKKLFSQKRYYEGVIAQVFYVGAQIMCWTFIYQYVEQINLSRGADQQLSAVWYNMVAMGLFLIGRAAATYFMKFVNIGKLMMIYAIFGVVFAFGAIFIVGMGGLYSLILVSLAMSLMFPTIYSIALKDMGDEAKLGSAFLVMAIVGGAVLPMLQARILDIGGKGFGDKLFFGYVPEVNLSFILPMLCLAIVGVYAYRSFKIHLKDA